jgi:predicted acylesterase/phospholipase RssA
MSDIETGQDTNTFEIGLVLAGAVSAGAYAAGVIDFLIEAIDRWYAAKESEASQGVPRDQWRVPTHDIRLRAISGSSAGSMVAALAAVVLNETPCAVNPAHLPEKNNNANKLYSSWVVEADIARMLETADLKKNSKTLTSLLDSTFLKNLAEATMNVRQPIRPRAYVADPLTLFTCVTNLRGVPYAIDFKGESQGGSQGPKVVEHWMSNHADYLRFDITKPGSRRYGNTSTEGILLHPDPQDEKEKLDWKKLALAAVASGAFPLALAPRVIQRDASDYNERDWTVSAPRSPSEDRVDREKIPPDWDGAAPADYFFVAVDGGVMNNEPLEYARQEIADTDRRNERSGGKAKRAIIMIDPFPDAVPVSLEYKAETGLFNVAGAIFKSLMSQAKFKIDELKLARDQSIYSRFIIAPTRDKTEREGLKEKWSALASNSLSHFGGFFNEEFRRHDFLLGRRNCQRFLQKYFLLPLDNPLFKQWPAALKQPGSPYLVTFKGSDIYYLPIIPLIGDLNNDTREPQPPWPQIREVELKKLKKGLKTRTKLVLYQTVNSLTGSGRKSFLLRAVLFIPRLLFKPLLGWLAGWLAGKLITKIQENLTAAGLLEKARQ